MKNLRGFTLVEIIVALAIFAIIVGGSASLILSGSDVFRKNADMSYAAKMSQITIDWLEDELTFAHSVDVIKQVPSQSIPSGFNAIKIGDGNGNSKGHLLKYNAGQWEEVFTQGLYENLIISVDAKTLAGQPKRLSFDIKVRNKNDEQIYKVNKIIDFPNLALSNNSTLKVEENLVQEYPVILYINKPGVLTAYVPPKPVWAGNTPTRTAIGDPIVFWIPAPLSLKELFIKFHKDNSDWTRAKIPAGSVFYEPGANGGVNQGYYITRDVQDLYYIWGITDTNVTAGARKTFIEYGNRNGEGDYKTKVREGTYGVKINTTSDPVSNPGNDTKPGDIRIKKENGEDTLRVFFPNRTSWYKWHQQIDQTAILNNIDNWVFIESYPIVYK